MPYQTAPAGQQQQQGAVMSAGGQPVGPMGGQQPRPAPQRPYFNPAQVSQDGAGYETLNILKSAQSTGVLFGSSSSLLCQEMTQRPAETSCVPCVPQKGLHTNRCCHGSADVIICGAMVPDMCSCRETVSTISSHLGVDYAFASMLATAIENDCLKTPVSLAVVKRL